MNTNVRLRAVPLAVAALAATLYVLPQPAFASARPEATGSPPAQDPISAHDAESRLNKSQFNKVSVAVTDGIATLTGTVDLYQYKVDAEKRVARAKGVKAVRNLVQVNGQEISDEKLQERLAERLSYDRLGFGNMFNAIGVNVDRGVVSLEGHARTYMDRDSAVALVAITPGVLDLIDSIEVDPVSVMDDEIRIRVARAVYGDSALSKYLIDPVRPIRISVQDGKVSLFGTVNNRMDAGIAFMRANAVPGVFQVSNYLRIPGENAEKLN